MEFPTIKNKLPNNNGKTNIKYFVSGDNPVMIAAKLRHKDLVSDVLRCSKLVNTNSDYLQTFIHSRNKSGQTLLHMVALQGPELEEQKLLILRKEIEIHCIR